jgi:hypothetical protein
VQTRYRILRDDDVAVARKTHEAGQSLAVIGEHLGVIDRTVLNVFRRAGRTAGSVFEEWHETGDRPFRWP